jgi:hypothetical protein
MHRRLPILALGLLLITAGMAAGAPRRSVSQTDLFFVSNGAGPYPLTWSALVPVTESVFVDGRRLVAWLEYTLDAAAGSIRFQAPPQAGQVVQVEYRYDPTRAQPNRTALHSPLALSLLQRGRSSVRMLAAFRQSEGGAAPGLLGFSAETRAGRAALQGLFLTSPATGGLPSAQAGNAPSNWRQVSGLRLGAEGSGRGLQYHASWTEAGERFAGSPELQTPPGLRRLELAASYTEGKTLSLSAQSDRTEALVDAKRGEERANERLRLSYQPSTSTALSITQETTGKGKSDGGEEAVRQSRIQLDQKWGTRAQAMALFERVAREGTAQDDRRDRLALLLQTRPTQRLALTTRAERSESDRDGAAMLYGLDAELKGPARLALNGGWTLTQTEARGARSDAQLRLSLQGPLAAQWDLQRLDSNRDGLTTTSLWKVAAGAHGWLKLQGKERDSIAPGGDAREETAYRVEAAPHPGVKLSAATTARESGDQPVAREQEATLALSPGKAMSLSGSLRTSTQGSVDASETSVAGSLRTSLLDVGGSFRDRERDGAEDLTTRDLQLALKCSDWLRVTGGYTENPEDAEGQVQEQVIRSLGLQTRVGSVALGGTVRAVEGHDATYEKQQTELNLTLNFSGRSALYTAYLATDEQTASDIEGRTYRLGFRHAVGSHFYLKLEGEHTTYAADGVRLSEREDTRANLGLGLRF